MSEKPPPGKLPPEELIELPLSHKESWDSLDKGDESPAEVSRRGEPAPPSKGGGGAEPPRGAAPPPAARPAGTPRRRAGGERRRSWKLWLGLLVAGALAYWLFWPSAPRADFDITPLVFPEQRAGSDSEPLTVTLTNGGERPLRIESVGVERSQLEDFVTEAEDCGRVELREGGECRVSVRFVPKAAGTRTGSLAIVGNMRGGRALLPLAGEAVAPRLISRPEVLDFGSESVGATSPGMDLALVNDGTAVLSVERVAVDSPDGEFRLIGNDCSSAELEPGESCGLRLVFKPQLMGQRSATVAVSSDSFGEGDPIVLEGRGSGPDLEIDPEGLEFESQLVGTRSRPGTLRLINRGDGPYRINRAWIDNGKGFSVEQENCSGASLGPGDACRVVVVFEPASEGRSATSLQIRESSGAMAPGIGISGVGTAPKLEVSATTLGFGALPVGSRTEPRRLRLSNSGTASLEISELTLAGDDAAAFTSTQDACTGVSLAPGQRCEVGFEFGPRHQGAHQASLRIASNQRRRAPTVELTGHGQAPRISLDRKRLDFAAVRQSESQDLRVAVSNTGDAPLRVETIRIGGTAASDFELAGNACSRTALSPGNNCQVVVRFVPRANGPRDARLIVTSDAGDEPIEMVVRGVGLPAPEAGIEVWPTSVDFGARQVGDRSEVVTIRISSTGEGRLELGSLRLIGAHPDEFRIVPGTCQGLPYVAPSGECTVGVRSSPGQIGTREAILVIDHNAERGPIRVVLRSEGF